MNQSGVEYCHIGSCRYSATRSVSIKCLVFLKYREMSIFCRFWGDGFLRLPRQAKKNTLDSSCEAHSKVHRSFFGWVNSEATRGKKGITSERKNDGFWC